MLKITEEQQAAIDASIDALGIDFSHFARRMRERGLVSDVEDSQR